MNANRGNWNLLVTMALLLGASACGPDSESGATAADSSQALAESKRDQGAMFVCDLPVPPGPVDMHNLIVDMERDRVYKSARPGFMREWIPAGWSDGQLFSQLLVRFDNARHANEFADWLANTFVVNGVHFWDRPDFSLGNDCHVWEVLGAGDLPTTPDNQVSVRVERFAAPGPNARRQLATWYEQLKVAAHRRGDTSLYMLYSEERQMGSIVSFQTVPEAQRLPFGPLPVESQPPFASGDTMDWSGLNFTIWYPYEAGDRGHPSVWPLPGIAPWAGDGLCDISWHESWHTTSDCLATCGNGAADPGETVQNCPSDVSF